MKETAAAFSSVILPLVKASFDVSNFSTSPVNSLGQAFAISSGSFFNVDSEDYVEALLRLADTHKQVIVLKRQAEKLTEENSEITRQNRTLKREKGAVVAELCDADEIIAETRPKARFFDNVAALDDDGVCWATVANLLDGMGGHTVRRNHMLQILREEGVLIEGGHRHK